MLLSAPSTKIAASAGSALPYCGAHCASTRQSTMPSTETAAGAIAAGHQILLHIAPGKQGRGSRFFGLHFHTWALILLALIVIGVVV